MGVVVRTRFDASVPVGVARRDNRTGDGNG